MYHLFIFAVIESFYIDIQGFVYLDNSKAIIFGKASFDHSFHCKVMDAMPETVIPVMVPWMTATTLLLCSSIETISSALPIQSSLPTPEKVSNSWWMKITAGKSSFFSSCRSHSFWADGINALVNRICRNHSRNHPRCNYRQAR